MDAQLIALFILTFVIHLVGALAYAARIAGTAMRKVALSLALFNVLILVSRMANVFQSPLLAKRVETNLSAAVNSHLERDFRILLLAPVLAALVGAVLTPTFQRLFAKGIRAFNVHRSLPRLLLHAFTKGGIRHLTNAASVPSAEHLRFAESDKRVPMRVIVANALAHAVLTVGLFAAIYAGFRNPSLRLTASNLSSVINASATILMFVFIDPYLSILTDDVIEGKTSEGFFRRTVVWLMGSRVVGAVIAQLIFIPASGLIVLVAEKI